MTTDNLSDWISFLDFFNSDYSAGRRGRAHLVETMIERIRGITNQPLENLRSRRDPSKPMRIGEILQLHGRLPWGFDSPSLAYTISELKTEIPDCEIEILKNNARQRREMLRSAMNDILTYFGERPYIPSQCPNISAKGRRIKMIIPPLIKRALDAGAAGRHDKTLKFIIRQQVYYWIPARYIP